jgi:hypothetical protein
MKKILMIAVLLALATSAYAFTPISQPDASYLSSTTKIDITDPDYTVLSSITDGTLTVSFSPSVEARTVSGSWATWGSPPDTESSTPRILFDSSTTSLWMTLSQPVNIFGFEAEPNPMSVHSMTAEFYNGATWVGSITRDVDGNAGARLFAAGGDVFTSVYFYTDCDFAVAQLRYAKGSPPVPEAGSLSLACLGLMGIVGTIRRRK